MINGNRRHPCKQEWEQFPPIAGCLLWPKPRVHSNDLPYLSIKQNPKHEEFRKRLHVEWSVKAVSSCSDNLFLLTFLYAFIPSPRFPNPVAEAYHDSPCIEAKQDEKNHPWWWHNTKIQCLFARAQYLLVWVEQQIYFVMFSAAFPFWLEGNGKGGRGRWKDNTNVGRCLTFPIGSTTEKKKIEWKRQKGKILLWCLCVLDFPFFFILFERIGK